MASLIIISGPNEGDFHSINQDTTIIGRGDDCSVQIVDERASRNHVSITIDTSQVIPGTTIPKTRYEVQDMGSSNGTTLCEAPLEASQEVDDGHVIGVGGTRILFMLRDFKSAEEALEECLRIGQGSLADVASHWPMNTSWQQERTVTD